MERINPEQYIEDLDNLLDRVVTVAQTHKCAPEAVICALQHRHRVLYGDAWARDPNLPY